MQHEVTCVYVITGYLNLYCELNVLPEVYVVKEALYNGNLNIFNNIIAQPARYLVIQSTPLFLQGFQTGKPLAFCRWLAEKGVLEGPLFLIFQQLVLSQKSHYNHTKRRLQGYLQSQPVI